ncbi:MAG: LysM peptidoglycan-binding domain-containing protein [Verrucomicrobia bacterium]|nr:LysM peptidoglycan-binding domain-containing protein [Verrucomicrobiota bacterium]
MIFSRVPPAGILLFFLCLALTGCFPSVESQLDEQKEPHFLTGKKRINSLDYKGAIESFEKALEANPRSASAHFELALLFEQKENDYAAAIYHYDRFLRLRPQSDYAKPVLEHVNTCKQELAKTVSIGPVSQAMQRDLERLHTLETENAELKRKLANYEGRSPAATNQPNSAPSPLAPNNSSVTQPISRVPTVQSNLTATAPRPAITTTKTHSVRAGETPTVIAKKYGVSVTALMAANPGVDARRLRVGQTLNLPAH